MRATIIHYNYIVKITYANGNSRSCPFTTKLNAEQFAKAMGRGCEGCTTEVIKK